MSDKIVANLNRVSGQVMGIKKMYEEGRDCLEVVQQVAAARSALARVGKDLLTDEAVKCSRCSTKQKEFDETIKKLFDLT